MTPPPLGRIGEGRTSYTYTWGLRDVPESPPLLMEVHQWVSPKRIPSDGCAVRDVCPASK